MSFADEVRAELYEIPVKKPCCRRALAAGLLLGAVPDGKDVTARYPSGAVADYAAVSDGLSQWRLPSFCTARGHCAFPHLPPQSC